MSTLMDICPDFPEWPERWMGIKEDLDYGKQLLEEMRPFADFLAESDLTKKTVSRHLSNLWVLGGEIIRDVSLYEEYHIPAGKRLRQAVGPEGGPYCRHLDGAAQKKSFDGTCKNLHKYLEERGP